MRRRTDHDSSHQAHGNCGTKAEALGAGAIRPSGKESAPSTDATCHAHRPRTLAEGTRRGLPLEGTQLLVIFPFTVLFPNFSRIDLTVDCWQGEAGPPR